MVWGSPFHNPLGTKTAPQISPIEPKAVKIHHGVCPQGDPATDLLPRSPFGTLSVDSGYILAPSWCYRVNLGTTRRHLSLSLRHIAYITHNIYHFVLPAVYALFALHAATPVFLVDSIGRKACTNKNQSDRRIIPI